MFFYGVLQNVRYNIVRANNVLFDFTIGDFHLMNVNDLIINVMFMGDLRKT